MKGKGRENLLWQADFPSICRHCTGLHVPGRLAGGSMGMKHSCVLLLKNTSHSHPHPFNPHHYGPEPLTHLQ